MMTETNDNHNNPILENSQMQANDTSSVIIEQPSQESIQYQAPIQHQEQDQANYNGYIQGQPVQGQTVKEQNVVASKVYEKNDIESQEVIQGHVAHRVADHVTNYTEFDNVGKWHDGFCACFDNISPSMLCTVLSPTCYAAQLYQKVSNNKYSCIGISTIIISGYTTAAIVYPYDNTAGIWIYNITVINFLILVAVIRSKTRRKYRIPGSVCEDSFLSTFLTPCSLAQAGRTLHKYEKICDNMKTLHEG